MLSRWSRTFSAQRNASQPIPRPKNFLWKHQCPEFHRLVLSQSPGCLELSQKPGQSWVKPVLPAMIPRKTPGLAGADASPMASPCSFGTISLLLFDEPQPIHRDHSVLQTAFSSSPRNNWESHFSHEETGTQKVKVAELGHGAKPSRTTPWPLTTLLTWMVTVSCLSQQPPFIEHLLCALSIFATTGCLIDIWKVTCP